MDSCCAAAGKTFTLTFWQISITACGIAEIIKCYSTDKTTTVMACVWACLSLLSVLVYYFRLSTDRVVLMRSYLLSMLLVSFIIGLISIRCALVADTLGELVFVFLYYIPILFLNFYFSYKCWCNIESSLENRRHRANNSSHMKPFLSENNTKRSYHSTSSASHREFGNSPSSLLASKKSKPTSHINTSHSPTPHNISHNKNDVIAPLTSTPPTSSDEEVEQGKQQNKFVSDAINGENGVMINNLPRISSSST